MLCGALGSAANPSLGPMKIESCGTSVRGYFGPLANATGFPFTPYLGNEYLESTGRSFMIKGKMVDGKFVAVSDNTCVGPCQNAEWECDGGDSDKDGYYGGKDGDEPRAGDETGKDDGCVGYSTIALLVYSVAPCQLMCLYSHERALVCCRS